MCVRIEALGRGHDRDAEATFEGEQCEVDDERPSLVDANLPASTDRCEMVQVGVVPMLDLATGHA